MAFRTGSVTKTRSGTEGAHTSTHIEPLRVPSRNSTAAQVLPSPDSLPSTKKAEQSLDTCVRAETADVPQSEVHADSTHALCQYIYEEGTFSSCDPDSVKMCFTLTMSSFVERQVTAEVTSDTFPSRLTARTITGSDTGWLVSTAVLMIM